MIQNNFSISNFKIDINNYKILLITIIIIF